jgi:hypothetical protein
MCFLVLVLPLMSFDVLGTFPSSLFYNFLLHKMRWLEQILFIISPISTTLWYQKFYIRDKIYTFIWFNSNALFCVSRLYYSIGRNPCYRKSNEDDTSVIKNQHSKELELCFKTKLFAVSSLAYH